MDVSTMDQLSSFHGFIGQYHRAVDDEFERWGRDTFPFFGDPSTHRLTCVGSDGIVTFYLDDECVDDTWPAEGIIEFGEFTLNEICQALHEQLLKIAAMSLGMPVAQQSGIPEDVTPRGRLTESPRFFLFSRKWMKDRSDVVGAKLTGACISPTVEIKDGLRSRIIPCRKKLWSPVIATPRQGLQRQFSWTHADFWWQQEEVICQLGSAEQLAQLDVMALRTINRFSEEYLDHTISTEEGATANAATILERQCDEFCQLLTTQGHEESKLQSWLADHPLFLDTQHVKIWSNSIPFGRVKPDFVIRRRDGTYVLCEIEAATKQLLKKVSTKWHPRDDLNNAWRQLYDARAYVRKHRSVLTDEYSLNGIYEPDLCAIIGRQESVFPDAEEAWNEIKNDSNNPRTLTYDELVEQVRQLAENLRRLSSGQ